MIYGMTVLAHNTVMSPLYFHYFYPLLCCFQQVNSKMTAFNLTINYL